MEKISFKLDSFEGPLDLLLTLIAKHKINIFDIQITFLLEQYMKYIEEAQTLDLEVASEFLEMASRLVYIKTLMLLPKHDEVLELKRELTGQLLEYALCKRIAGELSQMYIGYSMFVREQAELELDGTYEGNHDVLELKKAYMSVIGKVKRKMPPPVSSFSGIVTRRVVSVQSRILIVLRELYQNKFVSFSDMFDKSGDRSEVVATFLALLELLKSKRIAIDEDNIVSLTIKDEAGEVVDLSKLYEEVEKEIEFDNEDKEVEGDEH